MENSDQETENHTAPVSSPRVWLTPQNVFPALALLASAGLLFVHYSNRQDVLSEKEQEEKQVALEQTVRSVLEKVFIEKIKPEIDGAGTRLQSDIGFLRTDSQNVTGKVNSLEKDVAALSGRVLTQNDFFKALLNKFANCPTDQLQNALPALDYLMEVGLREGVPFGEYETVSLQARLQLVDRSAPSYWPVASKVLTYRSNRLTGLKPPQSPTRVEQPTWSYNIFQESEVLLDGKSFEHCVFDRCIVIYRGGDTKVSRCTFQDCVFVISIDAAPPPGGQQFTTDLLESNLVRVDTG